MLDVRSSSLSKPIEPIKADHWGDLGKSPCNWGKRTQLSVPQQLTHAHCQQLSGLLLLPKLQTSWRWIIMDPWTFRTKAHFSRSFGWQDQQPSKCRYLTTTKAIPELDSVGRQRVQSLLSALPWNTSCPIIGVPFNLSPKINYPIRSSLVSAIFKAELSHFFQRALLQAYEYFQFGSDAAKLFTCWTVDLHWLLNKAWKAKQIALIWVCISRVPRIPVLERCDSCHTQSTSQLYRRQ